MKTINEGLGLEMYDFKPSYGGQFTFIHSVDKNQFLGISLPHAAPLKN